MNLILIIVLVSLFFVAWVAGLFWLARRIERSGRTEPRSRSMLLPSSELFMILEEVERQSDVKLTSSARDMLVLPAYERATLEGYLDYQRLRSSLQILLGSLARQSADPLLGEGRLRSSLSVIEALHENFCRIPPFCGDQKQL